MATPGNSEPLVTATEITAAETTAAEITEPQVTATKITTTVIPENNITATEATTTEMTKTEITATGVTETEITETEITEIKNTEAKNIETKITETKVITTTAARPALEIITTKKPAPQVTMEEVNDANPTSPTSPATSKSAHQNFNRVFRQFQSGLTQAQVQAQAGIKNSASRVQTGAQAGLKTVQLHALDAEVYYVGPRDTARHSKWPMFFRLHGSIIPQMLIPLFFMFIWSLIITLSLGSRKGAGVNSVLLTILGFLVALSLSFRSSTAYERYSEGRRLWTQLMTCSNVLARMIWIHTYERPGELTKEDLISKLSAMNLIKAFAVALKHQLRFQPYISDKDINGLVDHLDTFAKAATPPDMAPPPKSAFMGSWESVGHYLGVSWVHENPRKLVKNATMPLGNLPLEILTYLSAYMDEIVVNETLRVPIQQTISYNQLTTMNEIIKNTDRIVNTPLPLAYSIAISQITWVYVIMLPFQLIATLGWITIPASVLAAYIILGILHIGREIENPFGEGVNDLPMDQFCDTISREIDLLSSKPKPKLSDWVCSEKNLLMFPMSDAGFPVWSERSEEVIRGQLKLRMGVKYVVQNTEELPERVVTGDEKV